MIQTKFRFSVLPAVLVCFLLILGSCSTYKRVPYFKDVPDTLDVPVTIKHIEFKEPRIQPNDVLQIRIQTIDPKSTEFITPVSSAQGQTANTSEAGTVPGYLVDKDGYIEMPLVGKLKVLGLTITEAKEMIKNKAKEYYVDPVVNIMFGNFRVTVLGEVSDPGMFTVNTDKLSLLDALGLAGDLTIGGKRENVMLIRENPGGVKLIARYDLNSSELFKSEYYYLQTGDVIYVEPNKAKARQATTDNSRDKYFTYTMSTISLLLALYTTFILYNNR